MVNEDNLSLYGLSDELEKLDEILEATGGEISADYEEKEKLLIDLLTRKVDGCCGYVQRLEDLIEAAQAQKKRLDDFIRAKQNRINNFETYIKLCLTKTGRESFAGELYEIKTRKPTKVLSILDESQVPLEFTETTTTTTIDKTALKKAVQSGRLVSESIILVDGKTGVSFNLKTNSKRKKENENESNESASQNAASI
jgi:hypothetical protein